LRSKNVSQGWVGYSEAQRLTGFGRPALRKLVKNGRLRATSVNRETRFDKYVLEAFVENHPTQLHLPGFEELMDWQSLWRRVRTSTTVLSSAAFRPRGSAQSKGEDRNVAWQRVPTTAENSKSQDTTRKARTCPYTRPRSMSP
jgi:hypothetical protein